MKPPKIGPESNLTPIYTYAEQTRCLSLAWRTDDLGDMGRHMRLNLANGMMVCITRPRKSGGTLARAISGHMPVSRETFDELSGQFVHTDFPWKQTPRDWSIRRSLEIHMDQWLPNLYESSSLHRERSIESSSLKSRQIDVTSLHGPTQPPPLPPQLSKRRKILKALNGSAALRLSTSSRVYVRVQSNNHNNNSNNKATQVTAGRINKAISAALAVPRISVLSNPWLWLTASLSLPSCLSFWSSAWGCKVDVCTAQVWIGLEQNGKH